MSSGTGVDYPPFSPTGACVIVCGPLTVSAASFRTRTHNKLLHCPQHPHPHPHPPPTHTALPHVYNYNECAEIDSQYFWSGAPWDMVARR
jgi:hypothetical protein